MSAKDFQNEHSFCQFQISVGFKFMLSVQNNSDLLDRQEAARVRTEVGQGIAGFAGARFPIDFPDLFLRSICNGSS